MFSKLLFTFLTSTIVLIFGTNIATGQDTIPPKVIIDWSLLSNYPDLYATLLSDDTLEVRPSCKYRFPGEYHFTDILFFEDDSAIYTYSNYETIFDDKGYGTVIETIIAEDNSGNRTKFVINSTIGDIYPFNFLGLDFEGGQFGNLYVPYLTNTYKLDQTDFVFCNDSKIDILANTSKNGCTGKTNMNWYIDNNLVSSDPDKIWIDLNQQNDNFEVAIEAYFSNTNFQDKVSFNIQKASAQTEIQNPTCSNSTDGRIKLDSRIFGAIWEHNNSDALFLDFLEAGTYQVSYWFNDCNLNETITLVPENNFDFEVLDSVINLSKNELLTIRNLSNNIGESLWQIGDSTFINNSSEFDYAFKKAGNYEIKLTDNSNNCMDALSRNIIVNGILAEDDKIPPTITITESQINENYFKAGSGFDGNFTFLNSKTLEIKLSCIYSFPDDYYFKLENATIEDDSGIAKQSIVINDLTFDNEGYGAVVQTITAVDSSGNTSKFEVITKYSGSEYFFDVLGIDVGGNVETSNDFPFKLENTDFEFCNAQSVNVVLLYSKNGCTSDARIDWYINNERVKSKADNITIDLRSKPDGFKLEAEGKYSNTNFQDRIRINIKGRTLDFTVSDTVVDLNHKNKITITNLSKNIGESLWQIGDTTFVNNKNEFDYVFKSPGNFIIKLTDVGGFCNDSKIKNIRVEKSTLVLENSIPSVKIGPNPFTDFLNINLKKSEDYEITIFGVDGRVYLKNQIYDKGNVQLNLGFLHPGIYVLNINSAKNSEPVNDFKIVKLIGN
jgi:hypothetical protein